MPELVISAVSFSLLALCLTLAAVRGKWIVFRLVAGTVAFVFVLGAFVGWIALALWTRSGPQIDPEAHMYIGWDPRALRGGSGLLLILLYAGYMALVLWLGDRHQRKKLQGRG